MDVESLHVFVQVAAQSSLTKAAVMLDSVQPAISRKIAHLERECGGRLFHRTGRGLTSSVAGALTAPFRTPIVRQMVASSFFMVNIASPRVAPYLGYAES